jgi:outer membrane lipopolysaccharide assembly protein LptE/RlpB
LRAFSNPTYLLAGRLAAALLLVGLLSGCGYHSVTTRDPFDGANGVNVVMFGNRSYQPGVEAVLARQLVDELSLRTGGKVLSGDQAQLELNGTVLSYTSVAVSYNALDQIREYRLSVTAEASLVERVTRKVLWKGKLTEEQVYPVNLNLALQRNAEEAAAAKVCRRLAEDIWQKVSERF